MPGSNQSSTASNLQQFLAQDSKGLRNKFLGYLTEADYVQLRNTARSLHGRVGVTTHYGESFRKAVARYTFPDSRAENPWLFSIARGEL